MQKFKYKAVLFDFDGTLFDTWPALAIALKNTYRKYLNNKTSHIDNLKEYSILSREEILFKTFGRTAKTDEINFFMEEYQRVILYDITPYSGVYETIQYMDKQLIPWGIVTNKPKAHLELLKKHIPYLTSSSCCICPEDTQYKKPHPEPLQKACDLIKISPKDTIYVGDSIHDVEAANRCHMDFALALYGYAGNNNDFKPWKIDYVIQKSLFELTKYAVLAKTRA